MYVSRLLRLQLNLPLQISQGIVLAHILGEVGTLYTVFKMFILKHDYQFSLKSVYILQTQSMFFETRCSYM